MLAAALNGAGARPGKSEHAGAATPQSRGNTGPRMAQSQSRKAASPRTTGKRGSSNSNGNGNGNDGATGGVVQAKATTVVAQARVRDATTHKVASPTLKTPTSPKVTIATNSTGNGYGSGTALGVNTGSKKSKSPRSATNGASDQPTPAKRPK